MIIELGKFRRDRDVIHAQCTAFEQWRLGNPVNAPKYTQHPCGSMSIYTPGQKLSKGKFTAVDFGYMLEEITVEFM